MTRIVLPGSIGSRVCFSSSGVICSGGVHQSNDPSFSGSLNNSTLVRSGKRIADIRSVLYVSNLGSFALHLQTSQ
jgi:hypothetical protein